LGALCCQSKRPDPEFTLAGMSVEYGWSSDLADAILERAKANSIKIDGLGMSAMPDASQKSLLIEARMDPPKE